MRSDLFTSWQEVLVESQICYWYFSWDNHAYLYSLAGHRHRKSAMLKDYQKCQIFSKRLYLDESGFWWNFYQEMLSCEKGFFTFTGFLKNLEYSMCLLGIIFIKFKFFWLIFRTFWLLIKFSLKTNAFRYKNSFSYLNC